MESSVAEFLRRAIFEILKVSQSFQKGGKLDQVRKYDAAEEMNCEISRIQY